jgi:hypothetical protein
VCWKNDATQKASLWKKKHFHVHDFDSSLTQHPRCPLGAKIHWYIPLPGYKPRTASHTWRCLLFASNIK